MYKLNSMFSFLFFVLISLSNCFAGELNRKIFLDKYFENVKISLSQKNSKIINFESKQILNFIQNLLNDIEKDFSDWQVFFNPEVEKNFRDVFNDLKNINYKNVKPWQIRRLKTKIQNFDKFLNKYIKNYKAIFRQKDIAFFDKIRNFNKVLFYILLNEDSFLFNLKDKLFDYMFFIPFDFVKNHSYTIVTVLVVITLYFYYNKDKRKNNIEKDEIKNNIEVEVENLKIKQLVALKQKAKSNECGFYALYNFYCLQNDKKDILNMKKLNQFRNLCINTLIQRDGKNASLENLHSNDIEYLIEKLNINKDNLTMIDQCSQLENSCFIPEINTKINAFKKGESQSFILNTGKL